jgi:hypothetical protein
MIRSEAIAIVKNRLGRRSDLDAEILSEIQLTQKKLERDTLRPWFLARTENVLLATAADSLAVPAGFLDFPDWGGLWWENTAATDAARWQPIRRAFLSDLVDESPVPGAPGWFEMVGSNFLFNVAASQDFTIRQIYWGKEPSLANDIENEWLVWAADLVIAETARQLASTYLQDPTQAQSHAEDVKIARSSLWRMHESREVSTRLLLLGSRK